MLVVFWSFIAVDTYIYGFQGAMYFAHVFNQSDAFVQQARFFANCSYVNKVSLYLRRAKLIDSIRLSLRSNSPESVFPLLKDPALDSFVVSNALRCARSSESVFFLIETLKRVPHFFHTQNTLYTLAKILAKSRHNDRLRSLIDAINTGRFRNVTRVSFMDRMQWYAAAGDINAVLCVWDEWRALQRRPCAESYNIVMGLYAQMGMNSDAVKTFRRMIDEGYLPNSRTYTVIIEHLASSGKLESAYEVFCLLPSMRMKHTSKQYLVLVSAFIGSSQFEVVKNLLNAMISDGLLPGRALRSSLRRMREAGYIEETDHLIEEMLPDERIKSVGYITNESDDDDEGGECDPCNDVDTVQLKPWMDPAALAWALNSWRSEEVSILADAKFVWTSRLVCKMIRSFSSADTAWQFFCWVAYQPQFAHDIYTVSRMIAKLARHGHVDLVDRLFLKVKKEGIKLSSSTIRLVIDFYGISGKGGAALKVFHDMNALCGPVPRNYLFLLYSSLLRTLTKCGMSTKVLDILDDMILRGIFPDIQTFSGLIHHFAKQGDFKTVQRLFGIVRQSGMEPDPLLFKVLICAYCKCGRAALALRVFEDMRESNLMPDASTKQLLVKSLWKEGMLKEAASVQEKCEKINGILPFSLPGQLYTVSSADLARVYDLYSNSFLAKNNHNHEMDIQ